MNTQFIQYKNSQVEVLKFGEGDKVLIAFHGFGDKAKLFSPLTSLSSLYTVYAVSFPYHGATNWNEGLFSRADILNIIQLILKKEGKEKFSIMGYSMGGKITLSMIPLVYQQLEKVYLLAPDGILTHRLYDVITLPRWIVKITKGVMRVPVLFFSIVRFAFKVKILSKFLHDFTFNHFYTKEQRKRFFNVYDSLSDFIPNHSEVQDILNQNHIPLEMIYGVRDEVIPVSGGRKFAAKVDNVQFHVMDKGHLLVDEDLDELLRQLLTEKIT